MNTSSMKISGLLVAIIAAVTLPASARADDACSTEAAAVAAAERDASLAAPTEADALEHVRAGNRAYGVQQFDKAIEEYTAAGLVTSAPAVLYNLGQALRASKQYEKSIRQYELFLSRGNPGKELRAFVECLIATMRGELDAAASKAPPTGPAPDGPEPAAPTVSGEPATPTPASSDGRSSWTGRRKVALGVAGSGVLAIGAGVFFGLRSQGFEDDASELCPAVECARAEEANELVDKAESNATYANVAFGVGVAAIAGAAVLWFTGAPSERSESSVAITPRVSTTFAGVEARWGF
jgi:hypothetical protein